jgi:hypothetical protein
LPLWKQLQKGATGYLVFVEVINEGAMVKCMSRSRDEKIALLLYLAKQNHLSKKEKKIPLRS